VTGKTSLAERIASASAFTYICRSDGRRISDMDNTEQPNDLLALTTEIVAAHVSNNTIALGDLPQLINQVYSSLANIGTPPTEPAMRPQPAVSPITSSVWKTARSSRC
jgi:predicted transcriptional regulator